MDTAEMRRAIADLDREVLADLEALPAEGWDRPSDCEGWTVKAAVIHLIQVAELLGDSANRGCAGDSGPPPAAADGVPAWRAKRAERLQRMLAQSPAEILPLYRASGADLDRAFDGVADAPTGALGWHPAGSRPLAWIVEQWLFELALHDWDIRVASDPSADVRDTCQAAFARTLPSRLARGFAGADDPALAGRYRIELAGASPYSWVTRVAVGSVDPLPDDTAPADVTIRSDPSAFALVMTNRRPVATFEAAGRWRTSGDTTRAAAFANAFKSY
jgi:uncharacterized protein (TIGR03083 family)